MTMTTVTQGHVAVRDLVVGVSALLLGATPFALFGSDRRPEHSGGEGDPGDPSGSPPFSNKSSESHGFSDDWGVYLLGRDSQWSYFANLFIQWLKVLYWCGCALVGLYGILSFLGSRSATQIGEEADDVDDDEEEGWDYDPSAEFRQIFVPDGELFASVTGPCRQLETGSAIQHRDSLEQLRGHFLSRDGSFARLGSRVYQNKVICAGQFILPGTLSTDPVVKMNYKESLLQEISQKASISADQLVLLLSEGSIRGEVIIRAAKPDVVGKMSDVYAKPQLPKFAFTSAHGNQVALEELVSFDQGLRKFSGRSAWREAWTVIGNSVESSGLTSGGCLSAFRAAQSVLNDCVGEPSEQYYEDVITSFRKAWATAIGISSAVELRLYENRLKGVKCVSGAACDILAYISQLTVAFDDLMRARKRLQSGQAFGWDEQVGSSAELKTLINRARYSSSSGVPKDIEEKIDTLLFTTLSSVDNMSMGWLCRALSKISSLSAEREFDDEICPPADPLANPFNAAGTGPSPAPNTPGVGGSPGAPAKGGSPGPKLLLAPAIGACRRDYSGQFHFCGDPNHRRGSHYAAFAGVKQGAESKVCPDARCNGRSHPVRTDGSLACPNAMQDLIPGTLWGGNITCDAIIDLSTGKGGHAKFWSEEWIQGREEDAAAIRSGKIPTCSYMAKRGDAKGGKVGKKKGGKTPGDKIGVKKGSKGEKSGGKKGDKDGMKKGDSKSKKGTAPFNVTQIGQLMAGILNAWGSGSQAGTPAPASPGTSPAPSPESVPPTNPVPPAPANNAGEGAVDDAAIQAAIWANLPEGVVMGNNMTAVLPDNGPGFLIMGCLGFMLLSLVAPVSHLYRVIRKANRELRTRILTVLRFPWIPRAGNVCNGALGILNQAGLGPLKIRAPLYIRGLIGNIQVPCYLDPGAWIGYDAINAECFRKLRKSPKAGLFISPAFQLPAGVPVSFGKDTNLSPERTACKVRLRLTDTEGRVLEVTKTCLIIENLNNPAIMLNGDTLVWDLGISYTRVKEHNQVTLNDRHFALVTCDQNNRPINALVSRAVKLAAFGTAVVGLSFPPISGTCTTCVVQPSAKAVRDGLNFMPILTNLSTEIPTSHTVTVFSERGKDREWLPHREHFLVQPLGSTLPVSLEIEEPVAAVPANNATAPVGVEDPTDPVGQSFQLAAAVGDAGELLIPAWDYDPGYAVESTLPFIAGYSAVSTAEGPHPRPMQATIEDYGFADPPGEGDFCPHESRWQLAKRRWADNKLKEEEQRSPFFGHGGLCPKTTASSEMRDPVTTMVERLRAQRLLDAMKSGSLPSPMNMAKYKKAAKAKNCFTALEEEIREKTSRAAKAWDPQSPEWADHVVAFYKEQISGAPLNDGFREKLLGMVRQHADCFYDEGCPFPSLAGPKCSLDYKKDNLEHTVRRLTQPLRLSAYDARCLDFLFEQQVSLGLFEKWSGSPRSRPIFSSPAFIAPRKGSVIGRIVVDYRAVNKALLPVPLPSPSAQQVFDELKGHRLYFQSDLSLAYNLVELERETSRLLAVCTRSGVFLPTRLPLGPAPAPGYFQDAIQRIFGDVCSVFMDDIAFGTSDEGDFLKQFRAVLEKCRESGARLSLRKTFLAGSFIDCLGHRVDKEGMHPSPDKLFQISKWPVPQTREELVSFICVVRYLGCYTTELPHAVAPLKDYELGKKSFDFFSQDDAALSAFFALKQAISEHACLSRPDFEAARNYSDRPFEIFTDASTVRYAWAICQRDASGRLRVLRCQSKTFSGPMSRWSTLERELFAIVDFIRSPSGYGFIRGHKWILYTDHRNLGTRELATIAANKTTSAKVIRWYHSVAHALATGIRVYLKGEANILADALSRLSNEELKAVDEAASALPRIRNLVEFLFTQPEKLDAIMASRRLNSKHLRRNQQTRPIRMDVPNFAESGILDEEEDDGASEEGPIAFINASVISKTPSGGVREECPGPCGCFMHNTGPSPLEGECPSVGSSGKGQGSHALMNTLSTMGKGPDPASPESTCQGHDAAEDMSDLDLCWDAFGVAHAFMNGGVVTGGSSSSRDAPPRDTPSPGLGAPATVSSGVPTGDISVTRVTGAIMDLHGRVLVQADGELFDYPVVASDPKDALKRHWPSLEFSDSLSTLWCGADGVVRQLFGVRVDRKNLESPEGSRWVPWITGVEAWEDDLVAAFRRLMARLPFPSDSRRLAGLTVPRRIVRKTDDRGDNFIIVGNLDNRKDKELRYFAVNRRSENPAVAAQTAYDAAWNHFGELLRRVTTEVSIREGRGPEPVHARRFQRFFQPRLPAARQGQTPIFSISAGFDPTCHALAGAELCPDFLETEVSFIGKVRTTLCVCRCGAGIEMEDSDPAKNVFVKPTGPVSLPPKQAESIRSAESADAVFRQLFGRPVHGCIPETSVGPCEVAISDRVDQMVLVSSSRVVHGTPGAFATASLINASGVVTLKEGERLYCYLDMCLGEENSLASALLLSKGASARNDLVAAQHADAPLLSTALELRKRGLSEPEVELRLIRRGHGAEEARRTVADLNRYRMDSLGVILYCHPKKGEQVWIPAGGRLEDAFGNFRPWRETLVLRAHLEACHGGVTQTFHMLENLGVYWDCMFSQVERFCQNCLLCRLAETRTLSKPPRGFERYYGFGRVWSVDHIGPFAETAGGYKYILSVRDHGTGYPWFLPVKSKRCEEAAEQLVKVASHFGYPLLIKTDQGFGDEGPASLQAHLSAYGVHCISSLPYLPTANSWVEGIHRPLRRALEKYANVHGRNRWVEVLDCFSYVLRTCPAPSLGNRSPYELMFGRSPRKGVMELLTGFGVSGQRERVLQATVGFRQELADHVEALAGERNALARARDPLRSTTAQLLPGALVVIRNKTRARTDLDFANFPAFFRVKSSGPRWVTLSDLAGRDGTGRASGKIPVDMVSLVLSREDAQKFVDSFGGNPPSTEAQLGGLMEAFQAETDLEQA